MFYDQQSLWPVICCMTVSEEMIVNRGFFDYKGRKESWIRGQQKCPLFYINNVNSKHGSCPGPYVSLLYPLKPWCEWCDGWRLTTPPGSTPPTLFEQWCGFFYVPQEPGKCKCCETGPMIFPVKLKHKFNLTSKNHFSRNKNQQYYPRFDHSINQTRKQFWFIAERKKKPTI